MHNAFQGVQAANIEWRKIENDNHSYFAPYSTDFDDVYFNTVDGIEESQYVFIDGNNLTDRFKNNTNDFVIFETGFGSGLNFLLTADLWKKQNTKGHLHYYSVEQFPLRPEDLKKIYNELQIESRFTDKLIKQSPPILPGVYLIEISKNITLYLIYYPLTLGLKELATNENFKVDAWFLDGFAPSKNSDMWHKGLWHFMGLHAVNNEQRQTSVATFTAASEIRKKLGYYGFDVEKRIGFGRKREMLIAAFHTKKLHSSISALEQPYLLKKNLARNIAVIGAGLAGCATAYHLNKAGFEVELFEQSDDIASGASKMPALLAMPTFSNDHNLYSQLTFHGFKALQNFCYKHPAIIDAEQAIQLSCEKYSIEQLRTYRKIYTDKLHEGLDWGSSVISTDKPSSLDTAGLVVPAIQVNGKSFCRRLISELSPESIHLNSHVKKINDLKQFDQIIICTGHLSLAKFLSLEELPAISPLRGQLTAISAPADIECPINYDGHLFQTTKLGIKQWIAGATFAPSIDDTHKVDDDKLNIAQANRRLKLNISENVDAKSYVGIRASTYDRFPYCGHLSNTKEQSIWLNYGYGTKGLCLSLLGAEVLTATISNKTIPLCKTLLQRISPNRKTI